MPHSFGWLPDPPDFRDYTAEHDRIKPVLSKLTQPVPLPASTDLRQWCPPIEDQGELGSCTAQAVVGLMEYFERRAYAAHTDASRLFVYKTTRNLMRLTGDSGATLRATAAALQLFGAPPEKYWPYNLQKFDTEPSAFCYAFGQAYQALNFYRLDPPGMTGQPLLDRIKLNLASGLPAMFGFTVYDSYTQADTGGKFPFPTTGEKTVGGHAVIAIGYNDIVSIKGNDSNAPLTTGALLIRNSWSPSWGVVGYGWLPYDYVLQGIAVDWWSLLKAEWIETKQFGL